jgi:hypothetical protein
MRRIVGPLVLSTVLLLSGCATDKRSDSLSHTLLEYANAVRWDGFEAAQQFVDPKVREAHPITDFDRQRFAQLRVSDYDDGNGAIAGSDPNEVRQTVDIGLINVHTQSERHIIDHQVWKYDQAKNKWWLETGLPNLDLAAPPNTNY